MAGVISKVLSLTSRAWGNVTARDVKSDKGGGAITASPVFLAPGDDAHPHPQDYALLISLPGGTRHAATGFIDSVNAPVAAQGERRIYSRGANGAAVAWVHLYNDGAVRITNSGGGEIVMSAGGDVTINGVTITSGGEVSIPSSLMLAGKEIAGHTHTGSPTAPSGPVSPTGGNI